MRRDAEYLGEQMREVVSVHATRARLEEAGRGVPIVFLADRRSHNTDRNRSGTGKRLNRSGKDTLLE